MTLATPVGGRVCATKVWAQYVTSVLIALILNATTLGQHPYARPAAGPFTAGAASPENPRPTATKLPSEQGPAIGPLPAIETADEEAKPSSAGDSTALAASEREALTLADVIASVYRSYPEIEAARQEPLRTSGELRAARGAYDTKVQAYSLSEPTGFYRNYRHGLGIARQTWWGGYVAAGYRIGRGDFQPWYKERETNKGGEFKLAVVVPTLQGRAIDPQRVAVFQASLAQRAAEPRIQQAILDAARAAAFGYWNWVAAGAVLEAQRELLRLAEIRGEQYEAGVEAGRFAEIDLILNQQLIAERRGKVLASEQKYRAAGFKLALFLRDEFGQPLIPRDDWLPRRFPDTQSPPPSNFEDDLNSALSRRPEPRLLQLELRKIVLDRRLACNELLPKFDLVAEASQDVGAAATDLRDKGWFQLLVGAQTEVPLQRRKARGKIQASTAKIVQINEKLRLQEDKIATELQTAYNALELASQIVNQAELSMRAAFDSLERYRFAFERGKIDLIYLNLLEAKANEAEIKLVESQRDWFRALATLQAVLGLDPLDQAMIVAVLPESERPGPGNLPRQRKLSSDELDRDWERHTNPPLQP